MQRSAVLRHQYIFSMPDPRATRLAYSTVLRCCRYLPNTHLDRLESLLRFPVRGKPPQACPTTSLRDKRNPGLRNGWEARISRIAASPPQLEPDFDVRKIAPFLQSSTAKPAFQAFSARAHRQSTHRSIRETAQRSQRTRGSTIRAL